MNGRPSFTSLEPAMEAYQLDLDNRPFVRQLLAAFPITEIVQTSAYLEVVRSDGHRPLWVHRGYTLGLSCVRDRVAFRGLNQTTLWGSG